MTGSYAVLNVSRRTFDEVVARLNASGMAAQYPIQKRPLGAAPVFVMDGLALSPDPVSPGTMVIDALPPVTITAKEYANLQAQAQMMDLLDKAGVSAWEGYEDCVKQWRAGPA